MTPEEGRIEEGTQRLPPAMEPDLHRVDGDVERGGNLLHPEPFDVTHQQHRAVRLRQPIDALPHVPAKLLLLQQRMGAGRPVGERRLVVPVILERGQPFIDGDLRAADAIVRNLIASSSSAVSAGALSRSRGSTSWNSSGTRLS